MVYFNNKGPKPNANKVLIHTSIILRKIYLKIHIYFQIVLSNLPFADILRNISIK